MMLVLRMNVDVGVPDLALVIFTSQVSSILSKCMVFLPMSVIMGKICPKHIEATSFALLAGVSNMRMQISSQIGSWINDWFVGCTQENLGEYWKLEAIGMACSLLPLLFIWLIPTRKAIEELSENQTKVANEAQSSGDASAKKKN